MKGSYIEEVKERWKCHLASSYKRFWCGGGAGDVGSGFN